MSLYENDLVDWICPLPFRRRPERWLAMNIIKDELCDSLGAHNGVCQLDT